MLDFPGATLQTTEEAAVVSCRTPLSTPSSAILGGGFLHTHTIINYHVPSWYNNANPIEELRQFASSKHLKEPFIGMMEDSATLLIALAVDGLGEPPLTIHPVVWNGKLIRFLERQAPRTPMLQLLYGLFVIVLAVPAALLPTLLIRHMNTSLRDMCSRHGYNMLGRVLYILIEGVSLKPFFALKMLVDAGGAVRGSLEHHDLPGARNALLHLVSRDRSELSEELVAAAAIESLAENVSDSVVAPLFYYAVFGLPGAALYRLFNTFDSMIGYHGWYEYLGKAAARFDDVLNLLPSRLTALLIIILAPLFHGNRRSAWHIWRRDAGKTESPNAGHPMAAAAGALEISLEKVGHYVLGDTHHALTPQRIQQAEGMVWWIGGSSIVLTSLLKTLWRAFLWKCPSSGSKVTHKRFCIGRCTTWLRGCLTHTHKRGTAPPTTLERERVRASGRCRRSHGSTASHESIA